VEVVIDFLLAVAAVGGDGAGAPAAAADHPLDRGGQLWRVGGVALVQAVIEHDTIVVVDDLALVAELNRFAKSAFGDRPGVAVMQAHPPGRPVRSYPGYALAGLSGDLSGDVQQFVEVINRPT
jgi:hypothetical protein